MSGVDSGILVAVPTYRRADQLRAQLPVLANQAASCCARILVVDNDPEQSARAVVESLSAQYAIDYTTEVRPGVVHARNAAIHAAINAPEPVEWLAFIDDDELPGDDWLASLHRAALEHDAAIVTGPVDPDYAVTPERWIVECGFFAPPRRETGQLLTKAFTGNMMIKVAMLKTTEIRFEPRLSMSGGEDVLFSRQCAEAGERIVWCEEARAIEYQPAMRLTRQWIMQRAYRVGTTTSFVELAVRPAPLSWFVILGLGCYKMLKAAVFYPLLGWMGSSHRAMYHHLWSYGRGMLRGLSTTQ